MPHNPKRYTRHGQRPLPTDDTVCRLYRETGSADAVAVRTGLSNFAVLAVLRRCRVPIPRPGGQLRDWPEATIVHLRQQGHSLREIADRCGCSPSTARNVIKRWQNAALKP